jgi:hypothetical protein
VTGRIREPKQKVVQPGQKGRNDRHFGYVSAIRGNNYLIGIRDPESPWDRNFILSASVRGGMKLTRGVRVSCAIGSIGVNDTRSVDRAIDVSLR